MSSLLSELPKSAWQRVVFWTGLVTSVSVIASNAISITLLDTLAKAADRNRIGLVRMPPSIDAPANTNPRGRIDKTAEAPL